MGALIVGSQAMAGTVYVTRMNQPVALPSCQGVVEVSPRFLGGAPALTVAGNSQCSNIEVAGMRYKSQDFVKVTLGRAQTTVIIRSNSGKHEDTVIVDINPIYSARFSNGTRFAQLYDCGGQAELVSSGGRVSLIFNNVAQCSNFDILSVNGEPVNFPNQKLIGYGNGPRSGSFSLPEELFRFGYNGVRVELRSNSGKHSEHLTVQFYAE